MSEVVAAALIGATASVIASALTYLVGIRSVRRSVSTSNGAPLGPLLESRLDRVERRLDGMERSIADIREWLLVGAPTTRCPKVSGSSTDRPTRSAFREGRERPPLWIPRSLS